MEGVGGLFGKRRPYLPSIINQILGKLYVLCIISVLILLIFWKIPKVRYHFFNWSIKYSGATFTYCSSVTWNDLNNTMERQLCATTEKKQLHGETEIQCSWWKVSQKPIKMKIKTRIQPIRRLYDSADDVMLYYVIMLYSTDLCHNLCGHYDYQNIILLTVTFRICGMFC